MSIEEFNNARFGSGMHAEYKGDIYPIISVDFEEKLIGIDTQNDGESYWVRCENVKRIITY